MYQIKAFTLTTEVKCAVKRSESVLPNGGSRVMLGLSGSVRVSSSIR